MGSTVQLGEHCGQVVAFTDDKLSVRIMLTPANRRATLKFLSNATQRLEAGGIKLRDRYHLMLQVEKNRRDLVRGYREYQFSVNDRSWQVTFVSPSLEDRLPPRFFAELPWIALEKDWPLAKNYPQSTLMAFSPVASLSEVTRRRWEFLESDGWSLYRMQGENPDDCSLPFWITPDAKKVLLCLRLENASAQEKAIEGAFAMAAISQAYFRVRTTHAPSHKLMHPHFLRYAARFWEAVPNGLVALRALADSHHVAVGPSITNMPHITTKVLEKEKARAIHLWLALGLVEEAFKTAETLTRQANVETSGKTAFSGLLKAQRALLVPELDRALRDAPPESLLDWDN